MSDERQSDAPESQPLTLGEELDELESSVPVSDYEAAHAATANIIADALAEVAKPHGPATEPQSPFIEFNEVSISFGDRTILDRVSFHVGRGQTLCILGRSGVGKSVSLRILLGFLQPDSGSVRLDGQEIVGLSEQGLQGIRRRISLVFQNGALFDSLTVGENIAFPLREHGGLAEDQIQQLVLRLLELVGGTDLAQAFPSSLSTGQRRCVAIARALAAQPEAIFYDEPTTMVDPIMAHRVGDLIQRLKHQLGLTSIVVTHDMRFAIRLADLVLFLDAGEALFFGPLEAFLESSHPNIRRFLALDAYLPPTEREIA